MPQQTDDKARAKQTNERTNEKTSSKTKWYSYTFNNDPKSAWNDKNLCVFFFHLISVFVLLCVSRLWKRMRERERKECQPQVLSCLGTFCAPFIHFAVAFTLKMSQLIWCKCYVRGVKTRALGPNGLRIYGKKKRTERERERKGGKPPRYTHTCKGSLSHTFRVQNHTIAMPLSHNAFYAHERTW